MLDKAGERELRQEFLRPHHHQQQPTETDEPSEEGFGDSDTEFESLPHVHQDGSELAPHQHGMELAPHQDGMELAPHQDGMGLSGMDSEAGTRGCNDGEEVVAMKVSHARKPNVVAGKKRRSTGIVKVSLLALCG